MAFAKQKCFGTIFLSAPTTPPSKLVGEFSCLLQGKFQEIWRFLGHAKERSKHFGILFGAFFVERFAPEKDRSSEQILNF